MSVTFWCPEAPRKRVPCQFCEDWLKKGWLQEGERCDARCDGTEEVSEAPEANFSQGNAASVLRLLGFPTNGNDMYGSCGGTELRQRIFKARNIDRSAAIQAPLHLKGGDRGVRVSHEGNVATMERMGAEVFHCGNTDEQTLRRLDNLEALAVWAQEHDQEVSWA